MTIPAMRLKLLLFGSVFLTATSAFAADVRILASGAMREAVAAVIPELERRTGKHVILDSDTAGALTKRIEAGEQFDVVVVTEGNIQELVSMEKVLADSATPVATVGIGVCVKEGAPKPDISTVEAFRRTLLSAKSVAYIDPASGASSGIYVDGLLRRLGIADQVRPKAVLQKGGRAADLVASGKAEVAVHQISEIVPVRGVTLVGPLPPEIQNITSYAAGISRASSQQAAGRVLLSILRSPETKQILTSEGMTPAK